MDRLEVICKIRPYEAELRQAGIGSLYLFGSVAENTAGDSSDVDLFFDLSKPEGFTLFNLVGFQQKLEAIIGAKVDLMSRDGIHPRKRQRVEHSAYQVF